MSIYSSDDLKAELNNIVYVDAEIAGKINYARYIIICENYIRSNYYGGKNKRMIKLELPVTSIGMFLVARVDNDVITFNSGERILKLFPDEIQLLKEKELTFGLFNAIIRRHANV